MKRFTWLESIASAVEGDLTIAHEFREELQSLDDVLFRVWNLGENIILTWTQAPLERRFLVIRHYDILELVDKSALANSDNPDFGKFIEGLLTRPKCVEPAEFDRNCARLGSAARVIRIPAHPDSKLPPELLSGLVTRYGVSHVRERAVLLLDAVGFSLHSPLEQVAMLNSLSYSINSAYRQLISEDVQINFARSTTGDGFYIWNRARTMDANFALYKLMMLILADNAFAQAKAKRFPVPKLRAAFHVGEHYEFYQVEALNPTTFSYIVGHVTIELARIIEKALPGQILLGDFSISVGNEEAGQTGSLGTPDFIARTAAMLDQFKGMAVANDHIAEIRCYLTGRSGQDGDFDIARYLIRDKHGITRPVYNAKINIYRSRQKPIFLGLQHKEIHAPGVVGSDWTVSN